MTEINKVYSQIEIKSVNDEDWTFTGIATSPKSDRVNDIVEPSGAVMDFFPIPLLWQHMHLEPVGQVTKAYLRRDGKYEVRGHIVKPINEMPNAMVSRLKEAYYSLKTRLVRGLSIGFSPIDYSYLENGGTHFHKWDWTELSLVTVPANTDATINTIKSLAQSQVASDVKEGEKVKSAGASATISKSIKPKPQEGKNMKTIAEQLEGYRAAKEEKSARMAEIMKSAGEEGVTLDAEQTEEFDNLESEVEALEKHISRLQKMEKSMVKTAKPVSDDLRNTGDVTKAVPVRAKNTQKLEPGVAFARAAKCLALGHLEHRDATQIAKSLYGDQEQIVHATQRLVTKAAVAPATTTDATWAGALVGDEGNVFADFVEYLRPQTLLGRFGQGGVPSLRRVPFRVPLVGQTAGGDGYWVGEGQAKPLTKFDFSRTTLEPLKVANIAVATMEVIRDSSPSADFIIRDQLAAALRERLDIDFIDPSKAAVPGVSPASILNGVSGIPSGGTDSDAVRADVRSLFAAFIAANNAPTSGVWLMSATTALALSLMQNPLGQAEFPGVGMTGGDFFGLPVIVSEYIPTDTSGGIVALVNAGDIYLGDEGGIDVSMSTEASLQMDNAPDNPTTATTVLVSLWQRNLVGFRAERAISWARRRDSAVAYLTGVNWGAGA